jgi:shikimate kinase
MRIYLIGFMGAGKTYWGKVLSKKLEVPYFDLDELIENSEGKKVLEIFAASGEEYFREKERNILHEVTEKNPSMLVSCGGGAPCFFDNIEFMNDNGITVWMNVPFEILLGRLRKSKEKRPLLKDLNDEQLKTYIVKKSAARKMYYEQAKVKIDECEIDVDNFIKKILNA